MPVFLIYLLSGDTIRFQFGSNTVGRQYSSIKIISTSIIHQRGGKMFGENL